MESERIEKVCELEPLRSKGNSNVKIRELKRLTLSL